MGLKAAVGRLKGRCIEKARGGRQRSQRLGRETGGVHPDGRGSIRARGPDLCKGPARLPRWDLASRTRVGEPHGTLGLSGRQPASKGPDFESAGQAGEVAACKQGFTTTSRLCCADWPAPRGLPAGMDERRCREGAAWRAGLKA